MCICNFQRGRIPTKSNGHPSRFPSCPVVYCLANDRAFLFWSLGLRQSLLLPPSLFLFTHRAPCLDRRPQSHDRSLHDRHIRQTLQPFRGCPISYLEFGTSVTSIRLSASHARCPRRGTATCLASRHAHGRYGRSMTSRRASKESQYNAPLGPSPSPLTTASPPSAPVQSTHGPPVDRVRLTVT